MLGPAVFVDLETSGLGIQSEIIQVAGVAVDHNLEEVEAGTFECKIMFDEFRAEPEALRINHYDKDVWASQAIPSHVALNDFELFLRPFVYHQMMSKKGRPYRVARLVGYNIIKFDGPRLMDWFKNAARFFPCDFKFRDVMQLAIWLDDIRGWNLPNHQLQTVCDFLGVEGAGLAHDALADVRRTILLTKFLVKEMTKQSSLCRCKSAVEVL